MFTGLDSHDPRKDSIRQWGDWTLQTDNWTLVHRKEGYEIDLESCNTSAELEDWIFQILGKNWATPQVLSDLLHAFDDIFDPRANLCSGGASKRINASTCLRKRYGKPRPKAPAKAKPTGVQLEGREFLDAIMVYAVGCEFNLWNLQGDMGVRLSSSRRGKCPAEIDFAREIAVAKRFGWLRELDEDIEFTEREQREDGSSGVRYGQRFVRTATNPVIKAQRDRFIGELSPRGDRTTCQEHLRLD
jgi:hypothetical protein